MSARHTWTEKRMGISQNCGKNAPHLGLSPCSSWDQGGLYSRITKKRREKLAPDILRLADELKK